MSSGVLSWLSLSVSGTVLALFVMAAAPWMRSRISHAVQYMIWLVIIIRLVLPVAPGVNGMTWIYDQAAGLWSGSVETQVDLLPAPSAARPDAIQLGGQTGAVLQTGELDQDDVSNNQDSTSTAANTPSSQPASWAKQLLDQLGMVWLVGAVGMAVWRIYAYRRFHRLVHGSSRLEDDPHVLKILRQCRTEAGVHGAIELRRSTLVSSPLLIGMMRPAVMLPERSIGDQELRYIFLHELTHCKRLDLPAKWLVQTAVCLHWFNPLIYIIAKRMDRLCELACDEAVIRSMSAVEKQGYGETLLAWAASLPGKPATMWGAMSSEGQGLKERLLAIMKSAKRKNSALLAVLLLVSAAGGAFYMGFLNQENRQAYAFDFAQFSIHQVQLGERFSDIDTSRFFESDEEKKKSLSSRYQYVSEQIMLRLGKEDRITAIHGNVYESGFSLPYFKMEGKDSSPSRLLTKMSEVEGLMGTGVVQWYDRGQKLKSARYEDTANGITVTFVYEAGSSGRLVWVLSAYASDPPAAIRSIYPLESIAAYKTPYVGNASKVTHLAGRLPVPHQNYKQQYTALQTSAEPFGLTLYYEPAYNASAGPVGNHGIPVNEAGTRFAKVMRSNALVLFSMIDNLGQVTFSFRPDMSGNMLDQSAYPVSYSFLRTEFESYGDLSRLGNDLEQLEKVLLSGE